MSRLIGLPPGARRRRGDVRDDDGSAWLAENGL
jgi:hypothetical protein